MTDRLAVRAATAAAMLDLPATRFRELVAAGALPPPVRLGDDERWRVADLNAALNGQPTERELDW